MHPDDLIELIAALLGLPELSFDALAQLAKSKNWETTPTSDQLEVVIAGHPLFLSLVEGRRVAVLTVLGLEDHVGWGQSYHPMLRDEWRAMLTGIAQSNVGAPTVVSTPEAPIFAHATWISESVCVGLVESDFDDAFPPAIVLTAVNKADWRDAKAVSMLIGGTESSQPPHKH